MLSHRKLLSISFIDISKSSAFLNITKASRSKIDRITKICKTYYMIKAI